LLDTLEIRNTLETLELINNRYRDIWYKEWKEMRGSKEYARLHNTQNLKQDNLIHLDNRQLEIIANRLRLGTNNLNFYKKKLEKVKRHCVIIVQ